MKHLKKFERYTDEERNMDDMLDKMNQRGGDRSSLSEEELEVLKSQGKINLNDIPKELKTVKDIDDIIKKLKNNLTPEKLEEVLSLALKSGDFELATKLIIRVKKDIKEIDKDEKLSEVFYKYIGKWKKRSDTEDGDKLNKSNTADDIDDTVDYVDDIPTDPYDIDAIIDALNYEPTPRRLEAILALAIQYDDPETLTNLFNLIRTKFPEMKKRPELLTIWRKYLKLWHDKISDIE